MKENVHVIKWSQRFSLFMQIYLSQFKKFAFLLLSLFSFVLYMIKFIAVKSYVSL